MLALTALRTQGLYRLISSTLSRYLLYEIVKHPARVLLIGCFKPPRLSRLCYLFADCYKLVSRLYLRGYSDIIVFPMRKAARIYINFIYRKIEIHYNMEYCCKRRIVKESP